MQSEDEEMVLVAEEVEEEVNAPVPGASGSADPAICHHCGKSFGYGKNLKRHIMEVHYEGEPVVCSEPGCLKTFKRPMLLELHYKNKHSDERPFECQRCDKKFAIKKLLTQHSHSCGGQKPYGCHLCTMAFASRSSLADHRRRSHEGRRFVCGGCSRVYKWKASLTRHCKTCPNSE